jgi:hypothetical protein
MLFSVTSVISVLNLFPRVTSLRAHLGRCPVSHHRHVRGTIARLCFRNRSRLLFKKEFDRASLGIPDPSFYWLLVGPQFFDLISHRLARPGPYISRHSALRRRTLVLSERQIQIYLRVQAGANDRSKYRRAFSVCSFPFSRWPPPAFHALAGHFDPSDKILMVSDVSI